MVIFAKICFAFLSHTIWLIWVGMSWSFCAVWMWMHNEALCIIWIECVLQAQLLDGSHGRFDPPRQEKSVEWKALIVTDYPHHVIWFVSFVLFSWSIFSSSSSYAGLRAELENPSRTRPTGMDAKANEFASSDRVTAVLIGSQVKQS